MKTKFNPFVKDNPTLLPSVVFKTRVDGEWVETNSYELFGGKRVVIFSLPGAFTPTCSAFQLPGFEEKYDEFMNYVDEIYCVSVNDSFVMNAWAKDQNIKNVKLIPDGSIKFTYGMRMDVSKDNLGFGERSWRYAVVADNGRIEKWFIEEGMEDNFDGDPYDVSSPESVLEYLKNNA